jgi:malonyl-CoA O-methyltransferase
MYNRRVKDNFERHALTYDRHALVQTEMARVLCSAIGKTGRAFSSIQEAGCGTGIFSRQLLDTFHPRFIRLSDISRSMLNLAAARCAGLPDVTVECVEGDIEEMDLGRNFDLFATNAVFQWVKNLGGLFARITTALAPTGLLAFNLFLPGTFHELATALENATVAREPDLKNPILEFHPEQEVLDNLAGAGFRVLELFIREHIPLYRTPGDFLKALKKIGAAHFAEGTLSPGIMRKLIKSYQHEFQNRDGLVSATYRVMYCVAERN